MPESTKPKPFCFVLMPFAEAFTDIYNLGIKETCEQAGAYCERVDEQVYQGNILDRVYNQIAKADFIIADMTGRNANVFYEVGYAHALGKSTILLTQHNDDIPFDLKHFPHVVYNNITAMNYPGASPLGILEQPQLTAIYLLILLFSSLIFNILSNYFLGSIFSYRIDIIATCPNISSP